MKYPVSAFSAWTQKTQPIYRFLLLPITRLNWTNEFQGEDRGVSKIVSEQDESRKNRLDHLKMLIDTV